MERDADPGPGSTAVAVIVALAAVAASLWASPGLPGLFGGGLAVLMVAIATIDARYFVIPDRLTLAGVGVGLLHAALVAASPLQAMGMAALRGAVLGLGFLALRAAYLRIRDRHGLGLGDVKLAAMAGVWLDWLAAAVALEIAALAALVVVAVRMVRGRRVRATTPMPFGLFFAPAIWVAWLFEWTLLRG